MAPVLVGPVLVGPVLVDPVLVGPVPVDPVMVDPVLVDPVLSPGGGVLSVGLAPAPPPEAGELDGGGTVAEELTLAGAEVDALGVAVLDGAAVAEQEGVPVGLAFLLPVALVLAFAEAVAVAVVVAVVLSVAVDVGEGVAVVLSLGLVLLAVLLLALLLGGLAAELTGVTLGVTDLAGLATTDDEEELGGHAVSWPLPWLAEETAWLAPPPGEPVWLADPATLCAPLLELEEVNPTAALIWPTAARSGGNARATPRANTAQAAATAGRSSPSRQSRGCRRAPARPAPPRPAPPLSVPPLSAPPLSVPLRAVSWPPRIMFQRWFRTARNPPSAPEAPACLLA